MITDSATTTLNIHRYSKQAGFTRLPDQLTVESPLQLSIRQSGRQRQVSVTMRTPGQDRELVLGFLYTEGILPVELSPADWTIRHVDELDNHLVIELPPEVRIDWNTLARQTYTSSSCGVCGKTSIERVYTTIPWAEQPAAWSVSPDVILGLPDQLRAAQEVFQLTGGIHACGRFDLNGRLLYSAEDVGRHNALDKLVGRAYLQRELPLQDEILVLSGRASFELVQKAAMAGIQLVVAVGAPSTLAVELAEESGISLLGFTRQQTFNCYSGLARVSG